MRNELTRRGALKTIAAGAAGAAFVGTASAGHGSNTIFVPGEHASTIQEAVDHANPGDTIVISNNQLWKEDVVVDVDDILLRKPSGNPPELAGEFDVEADDVTFENVDFVQDPFGRNHGIRIGNDASDLEVLGCLFDTKRRGIVARPANSEAGAVRNSEFVGCKTGIYSADSNLRIEANLFTDCDAGVGGVFGDVTISGNDFEDNLEGVGVGVPDGVYINQNNFGGNDVGVKNYEVEPGPVDAVRNWWGHPSGPEREAGKSGRTVGQGDPVEGDVEFTPWLGQPA